MKWLAHPGELGREPDALERMAVLAREGQVVYVWRFRIGRKPWQAAVSGPYPADAVGPLAGESTFSRFDPWAGKTAEEHARTIDKTLADWRADWAKRT